MTPALLNQLLDWYHQHFKIPNIDSMSLTIRQYFDYHIIQKDMHNVIKICDDY